MSTAYIHVCIKLYEVKDNSDQKKTKQKKIYSEIEEIDITIQ